MLEILNNYENIKTLRGNKTPLLLLANTENSEARILWATAMPSS